MWWIIVQIVIDLILLVAAYAMQPKVAKKGPGELQAPIADQGHPIPVVYGTQFLRGPNCVWYGNYVADPLDNGLYNYMLNMQLAICHGPAKIKAISFNTRVFTIGKDLAADLDNGVPVYRTDAFGNPLVAPTARLQSIAHHPYTDANGVSHPGGIMYSEIWYVNGVSTRFYWYPAFTPAQLAAGPLLHPAGDTHYYKFNGTDWVSVPEPSGSEASHFWLDVDENQNNLRLKGSLTIYPGTETQGYDPLISGELYHNNAAPTFPGLCYAVFQPQKSLQQIKDLEANSWTYNGAPYNWNLQSFLWGNSPVLPNVGFEVKRIPDPLGLGADASIGTPISSYTQIVKVVASVSGSMAAGFYVVAGSGTSGPFVGQENKLAFWDGVAWRFQDPAAGQYVYNTATSQYLKYTETADGSGFKWAVSAPASGQDANPANIIYDLLTNTVYGMGFPASMIQTSDFVAAGHKLAREGLGMSMVLDKQDSFDAIIADIQKVVDCVVFVDPSTGLWRLKLVRKDYNLDTMTDGDGLPLLQIGPDDYLDKTRDYQRSNWMDVANHVTVQYMDRSAGYVARVIQAQDAGNYQVQGELVSVANTYNSVTTKETAQLLALRDLTVVSQPLAKLNQKLNRRAWKLRPGSVYVLTDPELGIYNQAIRVLKIGYGTLEDRAISVECVEDVFGLPDTVYVPPDSTWVDPAVVPPSAPTAAALLEPPFPLLGTTEARAVMVLAARGANASTLNIYTADAGGALHETGVFLSNKAGGYTGSAQLSAALVVEERTTSIVVQGDIDFDLADVVASGVVRSGTGNLLVIDGEVLQFGSASENDDGTWTLYDLWRGVLDTVPAAHAVGARVWWLKAMNEATGAPMAADAAVTVAATAENGAGETDPYSVTRQTLTTSSRQLRPWVPGKFRLGSAADLPSSVADQIAFGDQVVTWKNRNRKSSPAVLPQDADTVTPESVALNRLQVIRGNLRAFVLRKLDGTPFPFVTSTDIGAAGSTAAFAAVAPTFWYGTVGMQTVSFSWSPPVSGYTSWLVLDTSSWTIQAVASVGAGQVALYAATFSTSGGRLLVIVTDMRGGGGALAASITTGETLTATVDQVGSSDSALMPVVLTLTAEQYFGGGLSSWSERDTGMLYPAGYGQGYGLLYGGN